MADFSLFVESYRPRRLKGNESYAARVFRAHRQHPRWRQLSVWARDLATDVIFELLTPENNGGLELGPKTLQSFGLRSKWRGQEVLGELLSVGFLKAGDCLRGQAKRYALALLPICQTLSDLIGQRTSPPVGEVEAKSSPPVGEVVTNPDPEKSVSYPQKPSSPLIRAVIRARPRPIRKEKRFPGGLSAGRLFRSSFFDSAPAPQQQYRERKRLVRLALQEEALYG